MLTTTKSLNSVIPNAVSRRTFYVHSSGAGLRNILRDTTAEDVLASKSSSGKGIVYMDQNETVFNAITAMNNENLGAVLVKDHPIAGIFTERDYLYKLILSGKRSKDTPLKDVMSTDVRVANPQDTLDSCLTVMASHHHRHLPVVDKGALSGAISKNAKLLGMISAKDSISYLAEIFKDREDLPFLQAKLSEVFSILGRKSSPECYADADDTVYDALKEMKKYRIGGLFVHDGRKVVGMFTERDYLNKIIVKGRFSKSTKISDVMNDELESVSPSSTVAEVIELMAKKGVQTLPVFNTLGEELNDAERMDDFIGLVTSMDVVKFINAEAKAFKPTFNENAKESTIFEPFFEPNVKERKSVSL